MYDIGRGIESVDVLSKYIPPEIETVKHFAHFCSFTKLEGHL